jgi:hypothetical protein
VGQGAASQTLPKSGGSSEAQVNPTVRFGVLLNAVLMASMRARSCHLLNQRVLCSVVLLIDFSGSEQHQILCSMFWI